MLDDVADPDDAGVVLDEGAGSCQGNRDVLDPIHLLQARLDLVHAGGACHPPDLCEKISKSLNFILIKLETMQYI